MKFEEMKKRVFDQLKASRGELIEHFEGDQKPLAGLEATPEDWEEEFLECVNVGQIIEFLENEAGFDHHAGCTAAEFIIDCMIDNEMMWYVSNLGSCVVVKAGSEEEARKAGRKALIDRCGNWSAVEACREATPDEIQLHSGNIVR